MYVPSTLPALLARAARVAPSRGVHVVEADGSTTSCPYPELLDTARRIAGGLCASGVAPETPVLLPLSAPRAFVPAFWGTVLSGRVPVPLPAPDRPPAHDRLRAVAAALDTPAAIVADPDATGDTLRPDGGPMFALEDLRSEDAAPAPPAPSPGDTALIQFSSGSTGAPKGVRLTHRNVQANLRAIARALQLGDGDAGSNWMPLYHDMGLVGYHLVPLFVGIDQFHLPTAHFLRRPLRWLDHLTAQPVTVTAAPTFGQRLVLRCLEGRAADRDWDLSDVRLLLNGAEPIDAAVMDRFAQALALHGLARTAMHPVYGLAEATLAVTMPARPDDPPTVASWDRDAMRTDRQTRPAPTDAEDPRRSVAVGAPVDGCEVRVVDAEDAPCPDGTLGHVQVRGDSIMPGYVDADSDADDAEPFTPDGWLRTGDLGVLCDGRLHVTGRQRDRLIVRGQTLHALDLERTVARAVPGVRPGKVAVCGPEDDDTGDVVLFLAGRPTEAIAERFVAARRVLQRQYGLTPDHRARSSAPRAASSGATGCGPRTTTAPSTRPSPPFARVSAGRWCKTPPTRRRRRPPIRNSCTGCGCANWAARPTRSASTSTFATTWAARRCRRPPSWGVLSRSTAFASRRRRWQSEAPSKNWPPTSRLMRPASARAVAGRHLEADGPQSLHFAMPYPLGSQCKPSQQSEPSLTRCRSHFSSSCLHPPKTAARSSSEIARGRAGRSRMASHGY